MATRMKSLVQTLVNAGANYIAVPNLYPKHLSPSVQFYAGSSTTKGHNLGLAIKQANAAIKSSLATFGSKLVYVDVNTYMTNIWSNHAQYGMTHVNTTAPYASAFCDGYSDRDWQLCVVQGKGNTFYWMQYLDMTTYVHSLVANYMYGIIKAHNW